MPLLFLLLSLPASMRGQSLLYQKQAAGSYWMLAGVLLFLLGVGLWRHCNGEDDDWRLPDLSIQRSPFLPRVFFRLLALIQVVGFTLVAWFGFIGNNFSRGGVLAWFWAIGWWWIAWGDSPAFLTKWSDQLRQFHWRKLLIPHYIGLLLIVGIAIFFRFYRLDSVPIEMWSDQTEKLLDVNDVLNGMRPIFFTRNTGREAMQFYLTAVLIRYTPLTLNHLALKVGTALVGLFALPFTYLLGKTLYDKRLGFLAALFLSFSQWHVAISRIGLRFPFTPAFATPTLLFLIRAFRYNRRNDWLLAGTFLGIGLHTYIPMRIVPLLLVMLVLSKGLLDWIKHRLNQPMVYETTALQPSYWGNAVLSACTAFLLFLPLFRYMVDEPAIFWYRVTTRSSDALPDQSVWQSLRLLAINLKDDALMFNYVGDTVWSNTVSLSPFLGWVTGSLFLLGVGYLLWRLVRCHDRRPIYLGLMLFCLVLPSALSINFPQENPSIVRTGGVVPIAMIISALPLWVIWKRLGQVEGRWGRVIAGILLLVCTLLAIQYNYNWYFHRYDLQVRDAAWNSREIAEEVREFVAQGGDLYHAYHVPYSHWVDSRAIAFNVGDVNWYKNAIQNLPAQLPAIEQNLEQKLFILHQDDHGSVTLLQDTFPTGFVTPVQSEMAKHKDFVTFYVPARE